MSRYVAFLSGMNLGGRRITNADLRTQVEQLGFTDVGTFRASGNVVLTAERGGRAAVAERLETGLLAALGYAVPVFVREAGEVRAIAAQEPFPAPLVRGSAGKLQVALLLARPDAAARRRALALATHDDQLAIAATELYWLPSGGISDSDLDLKALATVLGAMTIRTMGTIRELAAKHLAG